MTLTMTEPLCGLQRPRLEHLPTGIVGSRGPTASKLVKACGVPLDEWQDYLLQRLFDVTEEGQSAASEFGYLVSRQCGKGEVIMGFELAHLLAFPRPDRKPKLIVHSAHETKTSDEAFTRIRNVIRASKYLTKRLARNGIRVANGQQTITMANGNRLRFVARSKSSGRGFTADKLILDEAQECSTSAYDALTYTTTAVPDPQTIITGTVPEPGNQYEVFESIRDRGRNRDGERTYWGEWSPTGSEAHDYVLEDPYDVDMWAESIPALGSERVRVDSVLLQVQRASSPESLERERFSIWRNDPPATEVKHNEVDLEVWAKHAKPGAEHVGPVVLSVFLGRGGGYSTIAAASRRENGSVLVQHLRTARHSAWVAGDVKAFAEDLDAKSIIVDRRNIVPILTDLDKAGLRYLAMNAAEVAAAHEMVIESINNGTVDHLGQDELTISLKNATTRKVGNTGETWEQSDPSEPITQIQAVTNAHWGLKKYEAEPPRNPGVTRGFGG